MHEPNDEPDPLQAEFDAFQALHPVGDTKERKDRVRDLERRVKGSKVAISEEQVQDYLGSGKELARILVYLMMENGKINSDLEHLRQNILSEWELLQRLQRSHDSSRMPLYYAIRTYVTRLRTTPELKAAASQDRVLVGQIVTALSNSGIDNKSQLLNRAVELRSLLEGSDSSSQNPTVTAAKIALLGVIITAVVGIIVALINTSHPTAKNANTAGGESPQAKKVFLIDTPSSERGTIEDMNRRLQNLGDFEIIEKTVHVGWLEQVPKLGTEKPALILAHWHALRSDFKGLKPQERDKQAAKRLLLGLRELLFVAPDTQFVIYSSSFPTSERDVYTMCEGLDSENPGLTPSFRALLKKIEILPWPDKPEDRDTVQLRNTVNRLLQP